MKYLNTLFVIGCMFVFSACTDSLAPCGDAPGKEGGNVFLSLSYAPLQETGSITRSTAKGMEVVFGALPLADTRATDNATLENLCILQFEGASQAGSAVLKGMTYLNNPGAKLQLSLAPSANCFLYLCANRGDIRQNFAIGYSTYQEIMDATLSMPDQNSIGTSVSMTGVSEAFNSMTQDADLSVNLARIAAKVSFTYDIGGLPAGATLNVSAVTLRNIPKSASYVPLAADALTTTTEVISHPGVGAEVNATSKTYTWYIPENKRGNATADKSVTQWTERTESKAPLYATYIELKGNYTPYVGSNTYEVTYVLYLGDGTNVNNYDVIRNHHYQVSAKIDGIDLSDLRVSTDINLSADGLANCYLASKPGQWYRFNGTVRGNGNSEDYAASQYPGLSLLPSKVGAAADEVTIPKEEIADAVVVWETTQGMINQVQWDAATGCVKFKTGTAAGMEEGNALIAVRNSQKEILWSWHIWRTSFDLAELNRNHTLKVKTNTKRAFYETAQNVVGMQREVIMMDRNIGAAGTTFDTNMGANNIQYQFGRKDPFPGGTNFDTTSENKVDGDIPLYGYSSDKPNQYSKYWIYNENDKENSKATDGTLVGDYDAINYSIKHPEQFLFCASEPYHWISKATIQSDSWKISNCLWGDNNLAIGTTNSEHSIDPNPLDGKKTIYDPSPAGWRIAPSDLLTGIGNSNLTKWLNNKYSFEDWNCGGTVQYKYPTVNTSVYYPASGFRSFKGLLTGAGYASYNWSSSAGGQNSYFAIGIGITNACINYACDYRCANAFPIRCVKE